MTNTGTSLSLFDTVAALVLVETHGLYTGEITPAINAGINDGFLTRWTSETEGDAVGLTAAGRDRLDGFRALLAPADGYDD